MKNAIQLVATLAIVLMVCVSPGLAAQTAQTSPENVPSAAPDDPVKMLPSNSLDDGKKNGPGMAQTGAASVHDPVGLSSPQNVGDINLNGIPNEVADAVLYSKYFIYGLQVFRVDEKAQILQTDINADGLTLSVGDLVYQIRVIQ